MIGVLWALATRWRATAGRPETKKERAIAANAEFEVDGRQGLRWQLTDAGTAALEVEEITAPVGDSEQVYFWTAAAGLRDEVAAAASVEGEQGVTALAVETSAPKWVGRVIVRAAGRMALHIVVEGAAVPSTAMFTVPVECHPDLESAPGVRPWSGPVDEERLCVACLRALRGETEPEPARLLSTGTIETLPDPAPDRKARRMWAVPDLPTYTLPSLPAERGGRPIQWSPWVEAPKLSHYSSACDWCGDAGPCVMAGGRQDEPLCRFVAYRCPYCQEMRVYEQTGAADLDLIAHFKPKSPKGVRT
ncbi:hypothetical protein [Streptomyces sp. Inha503]|uniref:hypothetical protein n=1 Tax=Streptomyces sp. Inha503 TaxID=3383314 RepID=UPI0039A193AA